ncbi:transposase [Rhodococcus qingshengii]|nr:MULTISPECIES: IS110 family transposase [Rhodococcus]MCZ4542712.1 transposase [Rhodococcus qingshengii]MDA3634807.1 transposase [Rhodococcus sp. C-2]
MLRARLPDPVVFCAEAGSEVRVVDLPARAADTAFRGPVPGNGKTDAKDAFIIVDAARTLPDTLLPIGKACDLVEGPRVLSEFDADLAVDENRLINRLRSMLLSVNPPRTRDRRADAPPGRTRIAREVRWTGRVRRRDLAAR